MMQTIVANFKTEEIAEVFQLNDKRFQNLSHLTVKSWGDSYSKSNKNTMRSLSVYYAHDVMGKRKYLSVCKANRR